jgi:prephenate dehydrogenase
MKVGIIGLGLIGGSWGLALKKTGLVDRVLGYDADASHRSKAQALGLIDQALETIEDLVKVVDLLVLAIPVDAIEGLLPSLLDKIHDDQFIVDFGSTKSSISAAVDQHPKRNHFLAAHPIAGTEYSGPDAAFGSLYQDKVMILCDTDQTASQWVEQFQKQCEAVGMSIVFQPSEEHDLHLAYVSHLSHVTAFSLSNAVLKKEKEENQILALAGSGFESTVRLAKSSPEMWTPIFLKNRKAMLESVNAYLDEVSRFRQYLSDADGAAITRFLTEGREIRKILK